jgi:cobalt-precorrin-5B (C1)-methyltransferase
VIKDAGDDPDVTDGLAICATARQVEKGIGIKGGQGVGVVTRPGLACAPGQPAINPVPLETIKSEVQQVLPGGCGVEITIEVPGGEAVARKTMNARLGIQGGISILGTTGIVEPMSEEAFKSSLALQLAQAIALGYQDIVLTPGRQGEKRAVARHGLPAGAVIQMGNFVGYMLEECVRLGIKNVLLFGHQGKLVKVAAGIFYTYSHVADARIETIVAHAALAGADLEVLQQLWQSATAEETIKIIKGNNLEFLFDRLARTASRRAAEHVRGELFVGTVLTSLAGEILGLDQGALKIGEALGWKISR